MALLAGLGLALSRRFKTLQRSAVPDRATADQCGVLRHHVRRVLRVRPTEEVGIVISTYRVTAASPANFQAIFDTPVDPKPAHTWR
jgi:hypothetical protein